MMSHQPNQSQIITKRSSKKRWLLRISLLIIVFTATASTWLLTTHAGTQWLLSTISRISSSSIVFTGVNGTFSALRTESIFFTSEDLQLIIHNFELDWQPGKLLSGQLKIQQLSAQDIEVLSPPSEEPSSPAELPESLQLPLSISIDHLKIAALRVFSEKVNIPDVPDFFATEISVRLESDGQQHQLSDFQINTDLGTLKASAQLNGTKPFNLGAKVKFTGLTKLAETQLPESQLLTTISGDLKQLNVNIVASGELFNGDGNITLRPFAPFPVTALLLSFEGLNPKTFLPDAPDAKISLQTDMRKSGGETLVGNVTIKNRNVQALDRGGLPLRELSTNLTVSPDLLQLEDLLLHLTDNGVISGNLSWQHAQSSGSAKLTVSQLNPLALDTRLQPARISGSINLNGDTEMQRVIIALKDETLSLDASLSHANHAITLDKLQLRRHQSALNGQGKLNLDGKQSFDFKGKLTKFNLSDFVQAPNSNLNLALKLTGNLSPQIAGSASFKFENSKLAAQSVSGGGMIELNHPNQVKGNIDLMIGANSLRAHGSFGKPGDSLQLDIAAPALAQFETGIDGAFNLNANLAGSFASPTIRFEMKGNNLTLPGDHNLNHIFAHGHLHDEVISLKINATDYRTEEKEQLQRVTFAVTGQKSHHQFQVTTQINDEITIDLQTEGGLAKPSQNDPAIQWIGKLSRLSVTGPLPVNLETATKLELSQKRIFLGVTDLAVANGNLSIDNILWTPQQWRTQGKFTGITFRPGNLPEQNQQSLQLGGEWDVTSATNLAGNLRIVREMGDWILPGDVPQPLGLQTLQFTGQAENGNLSANLNIQGKNIGVTDASISLPLVQQNASWTILPSAPLNGQISANIKNISWIGQALDENLRSGGMLGLQANLTGTFDNPVLQGKITGENLALALLDQGLRLQHGKLAAHFDQASLQIDTLKFEAPEEQPPNDFLLAELKLKQEPGGDDDFPDEFKLAQKPGTLMISGVIGLAGNDSNLKIDLDRLPLAHEANYWILTSGDANIHFNENTLKLDGNISADAGILTQPPASQPKLADDVIITGQSPKQAETLQLKLDAILDLGEHFYIKASGLDGRLAGRLRLKSTQQQKLHATGSIGTRNAHFDAYGQNLRVKRGIVEFNGPLDDPGLNILAIREYMPVEAGVEVLGTVRRPRIRLVSTPNVPDSEKLSWIVAGRSLESGGVDPSLLLAAAGSILGGQPGSGGITDQLSRALGVDEISIRQSDTGGDPLTSQIGTVGKRLSSRAYLSYEQGLATTSTSVTKLTYSLTPRIRIVTQAGTDSALDVFYTFQFD